MEINRRQAPTLIYLSSTSVGTARPCANFKISSQSSLSLIHLKGDRGIWGEIGLPRSRSRSCCRSKWKRDEGWGGRLERRLRRRPISRGERRKKICRRALNHMEVSFDH